MASSDNFEPDKSNMDIGGGAHIDGNVQSGRDFIGRDFIQFVENYVNEIQNKVIIIAALIIAVALVIAASIPILFASRQMSQQQLVSLITPPVEVSPNSVPSSTPSTGVYIATLTSVKPATSLSTATLSTVDVPKYSIVEPDTTEVTIMSSILNVRFEPSTGSNIMGTLECGKTINPTGKTEDGLWWRFNYNGTPAYVYAQFTSKDGVCPPIPPSTKSAVVTSRLATKQIDNTLIGRILYSATDTSTNVNRILIQPVNGSAPSVIHYNATQPALSPGGSQIVFRNFDINMPGLSALNLDTSMQVRFSAYAEDSLPNWNPQGNQIVYSSNREGDRIWRIYTMLANDNSHGVVLSIGEAADWHPFQNIIVFRGCDDTGNQCGLWTINSSGDNRAPLTTVLSDHRPAWSPDGRYVVFMSDGRDGNMEIYRLDVSFGEVLRLTDSPAIDALPAVSPDNKWVAFVSNRDGAWKLFVIPLNGGASAHLADLAGDLIRWDLHSLQWIN